MNIVLRPARLVFLASSCVLLAFALLMTGCAGGSGSSSDDTAVSGDESLKTYSSGENNFSFQYPESWELLEGASADISAGGSSVASVGVYNPKGAIAKDTYIDMAQVSVYKLNVTVDDSVLAELKTEVESVVASLESKAGDMTVVEPLTDVSINGMSGYKKTYLLTKNDAAVESTLYFLFSGNMEFQVTVQAAKENWDATRPVFDALLGSFQPSA